MLEPCSWDFPDPNSAGPDGFLGCGADLEPATLVHAYRHGLFPWPHEGVAELPWFSPDPRALIPCHTPHLSRSLRRQLMRSPWTTTVDRAFSDVVAASGERREGTWITAAMSAAYRTLHALGYAHSVEVWHGDELIGGIYGIQCGGMFTGESMFHRETGASKVALLDLLARLRAAGGFALDAQLPTPHLLSLGASAQPRRAFLAALERERDRSVRIDESEAKAARLAACW